MTITAARSVLETASPESMGIDSVALDRLYAQIEGHIEAGRYPGAAVALARHGKLVAVLEHDTFTYDIKANEWARVNTDERIDAHDSRTVFAYDEASDVFLLADPKGKTPLAAFSLKTNQWEIITPDGPPMPKRQYMNYRGYYDAAHNAFVLDGSEGYVWVYRTRRTGK